MCLYLLAKGFNIEIGLFDTWNWSEIHLPVFEAKPGVFFTWYFGPSRTWTRV